MKTLTDIELNRIKIRDLMAGIKMDINPNSAMKLRLLELFSKMEEAALHEATDNDLRRIEKFYIKQKLGIEYFPSQKKKTIDVNGKSKIVPIDFVIPSEAEESHTTSV